MFLHRQADLHYQWAGKFREIGTSSSCLKYLPFARAKRFTFWPFVNLTSFSRCYQGAQSN